MGSCVLETERSIAASWMVSTSRVPASKQTASCLGYGAIIFLLPVPPCARGAMTREGSTQLSVQETVAIWWCFFCNNQFRFLQDQNRQTTADLSVVFGDRLKSVGRMLILMNDLLQPEYVKRIWCVLAVLGNYFRLRILRNS